MSWTSHRRLTDEEYDALAVEALQELLAQQHAVVWPEVEARLSERPWREVPRGINPHHLWKARDTLRAAGQIEQIRHKTKGGQVVELWAPTDRRKRRRAFTDAVSRKSLLWARYRGWGRAIGKRPNLLGQGGERVVHASLREAAPYGYRLIKPEGGEVDRFFGQPISTGAFDDGAYLQLLENDVPGTVVAIPIEVKNRRIWIYPWVPELFELLDKAARLQAAHPDRLFVPVLVCRRAHLTTFKMAEDWGPECRCLTAF